MVVKFIIVEGRHDAAFIGRILQANGYKNSKLKIKQYPKFIQGYLVQLFNGSQIEDSTIVEANSQVFLPSSSLSNPSIPGEMIVTFAMGGDSQKDRRIGFIKKLYTNFSNPMFYDGNDTLKIIYNLDADEYGIAVRELQINEELKGIIDPSFPKVSNASWTIFGNIHWGLYVFADFVTGKGKLEDLVLPLIESGKDDLKELVGGFIAKRPTMDYWDTKHKQYDEEKARISVMCQLEISGAANTTLLTKTGLIDDQNLQSGIYKSMYDYLIS